MDVHKIREVLRGVAQTGDAGAKRRLRAPLCTALGTVLTVLGARRKGVLGGVLAAVGGASLYRALSDWLEPREPAGALTLARQFGRAAPLPESGNETDASFGWAPESGEPGETRAGYGRATVYSTSSDDVGFAPESGDRAMDQEVMASLAPAARGPEPAGEDRVLEGSEESFPASDAPSWTPGRT